MLNVFGFLSAGLFLFGAVMFFFGLTDSLALLTGAVSIGLALLCLTVIAAAEKIERRLVDVERRIYEGEKAKDAA